MKTPLLLMITVCVWDKIIFH